jgi:hypothetical protein
MGVTEVVVIGQGNGLEWNDLAFGIYSAVSDVRARQAMEKIVGRAILLKDYNHMLNLLRKLIRRWGRLRWSRTASPAC